MDSEQPNQPPEQEITEEELRALYEEQMRSVRVVDLLVQTLVSLLNVAGYRAGVGGPPEAKDLGELGEAIDGARAILPLVEGALGPDAAQLRQALSQLQMIYAQEVGAGGGAAPDAAGTPAGTSYGTAQPQPPAEPGAQQSPDEPGPAESSGRLWVPGR